MSSVALAAAMIRAGEATCVPAGGFDSMTGAPHAVRLRTGAATGDRELIDVMLHDGLVVRHRRVRMGQLSERENDRLRIDRAARTRSRWSPTAARRPPRSAGASRRRSPRSASFATTRGPGRTPRPTASPRCLPPSPRRARSPRATPRSSRTPRPRDSSRASTPPARPASSRSPGSPGARSSRGRTRSLHVRPAEAAARLLAKHGLTAADVDLWEIDEALAGVAPASIDQLGLDPARVNVNGGAIAIGHPLAASGVRLLLTLAIELRECGGASASRRCAGAAGRVRPCCSGRSDARPRTSPRLRPCPPPS